MRKELQQLTLLNNVPLDKALIRLVSSGILARAGRYFAVNLGSEFAQSIIALCSKQHVLLKKIPLRVYFLVVDFVFQASTFRGVEVYLFGSYSKLVFSERSDVDIAVIISGEVRIKNALTTLSANLGASYGKEVQLHFFHKKAFYGSRKDPLVRGIMQHGVRLI